MARSDLTGAVLDGRYRVLEAIAEGAMGVVYRAERVKLGRIVAIKVLHESLPSELRSRQRFEVEAMAMAKLEHPHCAAVLDVGIHDDQPFVVMDFVSGKNLKDVIAEGPLPIARAVDIVRQVLSGLAHAHEHGIIHRDIKPANIVLSHKAGLGDHVKILDFGLARLTHDAQNLTTGIVVGTPAYMAPEQIRGIALDGRVDVYACGVLLFELLTGRKPFQSVKDDPIEVCTLHLKQRPPRLADVVPDREFGELEAVVARALAKLADDRYGSAVELAAALDAVAPRERAAAARPSSQEVPRVDLSAMVPAPPDDEPGDPTLDMPRDPSTLAPAPSAGSGSPASSSSPASPSSSSSSSSPSPSPSPSSASGPPPSPPASASGPRAAAPPADGDVTLRPGELAPGPDLAPRRPAPWWRRRDRRLALIGGGAAALAVVIAIAVAAGGGDQPAPRDAAVAAGPAAAPAGSGDPVTGVLARANELLDAGEREEALALVTSSRRPFPDDARLAYLAGKIYFAKLWWADGLRQLRDAVRLEPRYRADPELIKIVLRGYLTTPRPNDDIASFLRDDIGAAARPYLEETASSHPNAALRARAAAELRRY